MQTEPAGAQPLGCPSEFDRVVVELVNAERATEGLPPLAIDVRLMEAALLHAEDMAEVGFVGHVGSDGSTLPERVERTGYQPWWRVAENLAAGYDTPDAVVSAWMASPGHRANILDPEVEDLGVGYVFAPGTLHGHYWTQNFGRTPTDLEPPLGACPACSDAADNDGDGWTDYPDDPQCESPEEAREQPRRPGCGVGAELGGVIPLLAGLRRRRGSRRRSSGR